MRVVVFKFNHFGDNVVFVPAVQALRRAEPSWEVTLLTTPNEAELYRGPHEPQSIRVSTQPAFNQSHRRPWVLLSWMWAVRRLRPDACLLSFDQGSAAHLVARASAAPVRVGSTAVRLRVRDALTADVPPPPDARPATWHWEMARALLLALGSRALLPPLPPPPDFSGLGRGEPRAPGSRPRILIHAGASKALNQWGPARFAAVAERLAVDCEVAWVEHAGTTGTAPARAERVRPRTAGEMATALRQCDLFLGNNSGPMHLANALGCRGVAVTGPSAPGWDPYWHRERWTVLRHPNLACAPCERLHQSVEGCAHREHPLACLDYWSPETVEAACRARLALATP